MRSSAIFASRFSDGILADRLRAERFRYHGSFVAQSVQRESVALFQYFPIGDLGVLYQPSDRGIFVSINALDPFEG